MASRTTKTKRPSRRPAAAKATAAAAELATATHTVPAPSRLDIARRAFELFLARGAQHGRAEEDWLRAERELACAAPLST